MLELELIELGGPPLFLVLLAAAQPVGDRGDAVVGLEHRRERAFGPIKHHVAYLLGKPLVLQPRHERGPAVGGLGRCARGTRRRAAALHRAAARQPGRGAAARRAQPSGGRATAHRTHNLVGPARAAIARELVDQLALWRPDLQELVHAAGNVHALALQRTEHSRAGEELTRRERVHCRTQAASERVVSKQPQLAVSE